MGTKSSAQARADLRNYAGSIAQDRMGAVAFFLLPIVGVFATTGQYKRWAQRNAFLRAANIKFAAGTEPSRIKMEADDPTFSLSNYGLGVGLSDQERDDAGRLLAGANASQIERNKVRSLLSTILNEVELEWMTFLNANVSATSGVGGWMGSHADALAAKPIKELKERMTVFGKRVGRRPNRVVFSQSAFDVITEHPNVVTRTAGSDLGTVNVAGLEKLLGLQPGQVRVGNIAYDTTKQGKTASNSLVLGDQVWMTYSEENPSVEDASGGKTFMLNGNGLENVLQVRDDLASTDVFQVLFRADKAITYPDAFERIDLSTPS